MKARGSIDPAVFSQRLFARYENEICHLHWDRDRPWTLVFAVILSAQCTDKMVNKVTPKLFASFPDLESFVAKPIEDLKAIIRPLGYYNAKAEHIRNCAEGIILRHNGAVPDTMEELTALAGIGRKTANVLLWNIFGKNEGFVVDTHIGRISQRVGLTRHRYPEKIEQDLMKKFPQAHWGKMSHMLVQFGRDHCKAPVPKCSTCFFQDVCPQRGVKKSK